MMLTMKKSLFVLSAFVIGMQVVFANNPVREGYTISGHVIEKDSEEDIPYATILIVGTDHGTVSNEVGQFQFKTFPRAPTCCVCRPWATAPWRRAS